MQHVPDEPKALLQGCDADWDDSDGTTPGDVGGVVIPHTAEGLQMVTCAQSKTQQSSEKEHVRHLDPGSHTGNQAGIKCETNTNF